MKILVTGSAGFIGFHLTQRLLEAGHSVVGFDSFSPYYDPKLKRSRTAILVKYPNFESIEASLEDHYSVTDTVNRVKPEIVVHLAAQAGVRYSLENPTSYIQSNVVGTHNLLEALRYSPPKHFMFASTSSVYGGNTDLPFEETQRTDFPVSLYAATKKSGEAMSHSYAHLFGIPTTCFRFFTVYGPWGRPDMALFKFVDKIIDGEEIEVYGNGDMSRDFTYVDDLVDAILRLLPEPPPSPQRRLPAHEYDSISPVAPWRTVNIAGGNTVSLREFIETIENSIGKVALKRFLPMQDGDVTDTLASPELLTALTNYRPTTTIDEGVAKFVDWYLEYKEISET